MMKINRWLQDDIITEVKVTKIFPRRELMLFKKNFSQCKSKPKTPDIYLTIK